MLKDPRRAPRLAKVRVRYPLARGRIVLRAAQDWERDIEPVATDRAGTRFDYVVDLKDDPFCYCRLLLKEGGREVRARGPDSLALPGAAPLEVYPYFFGEPRCSVCTLQTRPSRLGDRAHRFRVFTPPGYDENTLARYPVLYMHDGQNLFFPDEAFQGETWQVEETLRRLDAMNLVRPMIVVGVWPSDRMRDYTKPGYDDFGRYLADEVRPWVDAHYRTLRDPRHTAVMGSSLGGVVSFHLAWTRPDVFGGAACLSSTFGYRDDLMDRVATEPARAVRFYLDSGWPGDNYEVTLAMRDLLKARGWTDRDLMYVAFPEATHDERSWAARLHQPLQFLFPRS